MHVTGSQASQQGIQGSSTCRLHEAPCSTDACPAGGCKSTERAHRLRHGSPLNEGDVSVLAGKLGSMIAEQVPATTWPCVATGTMCVTCACPSMRCGLCLRAATSVSALGNLRAPERCVAGRRVHDDAAWALAAVDEDLSTVYSGGRDGKVPPSAHMHSLLVSLSLK
jgi:hypothetical protein